MITVILKMKVSSGYDELLLNDGDKGVFMNAAHALCTSEYREQFDADFPGQEFEKTVPLDRGEIDPVELVETGGFPFIYIQLEGVNA